MIEGIAQAAKELIKIWSSIHGSSIAWEIENENIEAPCKLIAAKQGYGEKDGAWANSIPAGEVSECGTENDGIAGNVGGVVYSVGDSKTYFAVVWDDPWSGPSDYIYSIGSESQVVDFAKKWWTQSFDGLDIGSGEFIRHVVGEVTISIQPGFDPFRITFSKTTSEDTSAERKSKDTSAEFSYSAPVTPRSSSPEQPQDPVTREQLAAKQETFAIALLQNAQQLRGE